MNKDRRKMIDAAIKDAEALAGQLDDLRAAIETIRDEEQEYLDAMPENLHGGERYSAAEDAINQLDAAIEALDSFSVEDVVSNLSDAAA